MQDALEQTFQHVIDYNEVKNQIGNFTNYVNTAVTITDLDNIPINGSGRIKLDASISPNGSLYVYNFVSSGSTSAERSIIVIDNYRNKEYKTNKYNNGAWGEWYSTDDQIGNKEDYEVLTSGSLLSAVQSMTMVGSKVFFVKNNAVTDKPYGYRGVAFCTKNASDEYSVLYIDVAGNVFINNMYGVWTGWKKLATDEQIANKTYLVKNDIGAT